jgi:copper chaperone CopZ
MSALSEKTKIKNEIKSLDAQLATADASVKAQLEQKKAELT